MEFVTNDPAVIWTSSVISRWPKYSGMAANCAATTDDGAAGNADAGRDRGVLADAHIVGDLASEFIELHAVPMTVVVSAPRS